MNAVKHSYEDEVRLLDTEVAELRAKLRQSTSYIQELQKRFEENMRSIYR
jgi:peptidoglycan hydrolase CwlO-like protein